MLVVAIGAAPVAAFAGDHVAAFCLEKMSACPDAHEAPPQSVDACCAQEPATDVDSQPADSENDSSGCSDCPCCLAVVQTVVCSVPNKPFAHPALSLVEVVQPIASLRPLTLADDIHLRPPIA